MTPANRSTALATRTRAWLRRLDAYTLEVFNPPHVRRRHPALSADRH